MSNIRKLSSKIESLDAEEAEEGFIDGEVDVGSPILSFNFGAKPETVSQSAAKASGTPFRFDSSPIVWWYAASSYRLFQKLSSF